FGKEKEFFIQCGELVEELTWNDIRKIGGILIESHERVVKNYYAKLFDYTLPDRLKLNVHKIVEVKSGYYVLYTYSHYDPIELPIPVFESLRYFDGRPVPEIMKQIKEEKDISFDDSLLQLFVDFKLLVPLE
ncbi:MAG: hypothetical protein HQK77_18675, partial [Desulfobacterales bacterium]|nr:hypothetical protein [Desulfobacterales bacterium]